MIKQVTVFLENKTGRIEEIVGYLADEGVNIHALAIGDTTDFGILRMIVSNPEKAVDVLKEKNAMVKTTDVVAIAIAHDPGSLHKILQQLRELDLSIEYMYAFTSRHKDYNALAIFSLNDQETAVKKLAGSRMPLLNEKLLNQLNDM